MYKYINGYIRLCTGRHVLPNAAMLGTQRGIFRGILSSSLTVNYKNVSILFRKALRLTTPAGVVFSLTALTTSQKIANISSTASSTVCLDWNTVDTTQLVRFTRYTYAYF